MKIGRTNAITISGGGTTKTDYELWQEGFGYNWDSVVANAPMANTQRILHLYTKVEMIKMISTFPTTAEIYTYNGSVYRRIIMDSNKRLAFIGDDYMTNSFDNLQYVCVIYGNATWGSNYFSIFLPVVYANSKACNNLLTNADTQVNLLINIDYNRYPFLRGLDVFTLKNINLYGGIEHVTCQYYNSTITAFCLRNLSDCEGRILRSLVENAPLGTTFLVNAGDSTILIMASFTDEKLADWFYNVFFYNGYSKTFYIFAANNIIRNFKINTNLLMSLNGYVSGLPEFQYLEGTITENQTAATNIGCHGFRGTNSKYQQQKNFPLWTVLEGASTGCLRPLQVANTNGSFVFSSLQLERSNFAVFDELGNIDTSDPTKSFVANLPVLSGSIVQSIRFEDTTFKNQFTENERSQIVSVITAYKKWDLIW